MLKLFQEGEGVVRVSVYVALGISLGYRLFPSENALACEDALRRLRERGLGRVLLFITDGLPGLAEAIRRVYPLAQWQRCVVHGVWWSLAQVKPRDRASLAEDLRRVYGAQSRGGALQALEGLKKAWGSRYPWVVETWWESGAFLRFYECLRMLWPYLRSTNLKVQRGTKVRDHKFPKEAATYKLLYLEAERLEARCEERRLKGFTEAKETPERMLQERTDSYTNFLTRPVLQLVGVINSILELL